MNFEKKGGEKQMNTKMVIGLVVVILAVAGGAIWFTQSQQSQKIPSPDTQIVQPSPADSMMEEKSEASDESTIKNNSAVVGDGEFVITSKGLVFDPNGIKVKKGQSVKVTYKNTKGAHNFAIDEFKVKTKTINAGEEETVEFIAEREGEFEFYCSVPGHKAAGMKGVLVVE